MKKINTFPAYIKLNFTHHFELPSFGQFWIVSSNECSPIWNITLPSNVTVDDNTFVHNKTSDDHQIISIPTPPPTMLYTTQNPTFPSTIFPTVSSSTIPPSTQQKNNDDMKIPPKSKSAKNIPIHKNPIHKKSDHKKNDSNNSDLIC